MADKLSGVKVEDSFLSTGIQAFNCSAISFDLPTVKVKVENELISEDENEANHTGLTRQLAVENEKQNCGASILLDRRLIVADDLSNVKVEGTVLSTGNYASNATSFNLPTVKVKVESELRSEEHAGITDTGTGRRKIKVEKAGASSGESSAEIIMPCTNNSEFADTNELTKEEDLGVCFEEQKESTCADFVSRESFKGEEDSCHGDQVFGKMEVNHEFKGFGSSSCEPVVSSSVNAEFMGTECDKSNSLQDCLLALTSEGPFSCSKCCERFQTEQLLKQHAVIHADKEQFSCPHCPSKFTRKSIMKAHLAIHSHDEPFACPHCPSIFTHYSHMKVHLATHSNDKPFACPHCPSKFALKSTMEIHLAVHTTERLACPHCPSKFTAKSHLKSHLVIHSNNDPFVCPHCPAKFTQKGSMKRHLATHTSDFSFAYCPHCPAKFNYKRDMNKHLASHSYDKPFACAHCPSKFTLKDSMRKHMAIHSNDKSFQCPHCPSKFTLKAYLKRHLVTHSNDKPFACPHCAFKFTRNSDMKRHLGTHLNDKRFTCPHCPAKFNRKIYLKEHLVLHSNKERFLCDHCTATFKSKSQLSQHVVLHINKK